MKDKLSLKKNRFWLVIFASLASLAAIIGFASFAATTVTHTFTISPAGAGTVNGGSISCPSRCTYNYATSSTPVTYTATPASGYKFIGWENKPSVRAGMDYSTNPLPVIRTTSWNFTANFQKIVVPPPAPAPTPPPAPAPTPAPKPKPSSGRSSSGAPAASTADNITAPLEDTQPPTAPTGLEGVFVVDENSIKLIWVSATDNVEVSGYEVERTPAGEEGWAKIGDSLNVEYIDFRFEPDKVYQYRVRAYDQVKNYSGYSNVTEVSSGGFFPNVFVKDGGKVTSDSVYLDFPNGSVTEDLFVTAEKSPVTKITLSSGTKRVGDIFELKAKNSRGEEITKFKTQITVRIGYTKNQIGGGSETTIKLANYVDDKVTILPTSLDIKNKKATTLTDHFSTYFLVAQKSSPWVTFFKILLWIVLLAALAGGGYYLYILYQRKKYREAHKDDYIYRS